VFLKMQFEPEKDATARDAAPDLSGRGPHRQ
jgi:hypothetical protein